MQYPTLSSPGEIMGSAVCRPVKLTRRNMKFLIENTKFDEPTIREMFEEFSKLNPTGRMNLVNLLQIYQDFFPEKNCENFCRHVFRVLDLDQNGVVDFREFLLSLNTIISGSVEEQIKVGSLQGN